jgi:type IV fimbrial biogenesis protein FimT
MRNGRGMTLIEMLTALTVVGIVGAFVLPAFHTVRSDSVRTAAVNRFFHALFLARSESVKRGGVVSICKSLDGRFCAQQAEWTAGWLVFANSDRDEPPERDSGEQVIAAYEGWSQGRISSNRLAYSFRPHIQGVVNGTIIFCDARGPEHARAIIISHTGRPRVAQRDSNGKALRCPGA